MSVLSNKQKAFKVFDEMKHRQVIIIKDFAKRDPASFIQYGKDYIDKGGNIEFNGDYSKIFKLSRIEDFKSFKG